MRRKWATHDGDKWTTKPMRKEKFNGDRYLPFDGIFVIIFVLFPYVFPFRKRKEKKWKANPDRKAHASLSPALQGKRTLFLEISRRHILSDDQRRRHSLAHMHNAIMAGIPVPGSGICQSSGTLLFVVYLFREESLLPFFFAAISVFMLRGHEGSFASLVIRLKTGREIDDERYAAVTSPSE
ncbi:hypothetical protein CEXT_404261 [Caerostris extrusa]|uniref:Uncharacterized protein n=1 Tax=Caerostris extrusa TaxID=172846 RepID=A0AAV4NB47_CAEEX|nr:hypothetical protein CEXT_404261 [Caerostris extrusa]